jgi:hypothetical protein
MPNIESPVQFCARDFGKENSELCYMINSWMDAPSRKLEENIECGVARVSYVSPWAGRSSFRL